MQPLRAQARRVLSMRLLSLLAKASSINGPFPFGAVRRRTRRRGHRSGFRPPSRPNRLNRGCNETECAKPIPAADRYKMNKHRPKLEKGGNFGLYKDATSHVKRVIDLRGNQHPSVANSAFLRGWETLGCNRTRNGGGDGTIRKKRYFWK